MELEKSQKSNPLYLQQTPKEHEATKLAVKTFLESDGPALQEKLQTYATDKKSYIEEFWYAQLHYINTLNINRH